MMLLVLLATIQLISSASLPGETIIEPENVDLTADAAIIRKAVKGWGTDEKAIINVLANRRYNTRLMLSNVYEREFDRTLWGDIKSDTSGDFRGVLKGLVMTEAQFLAEEMRSAMQGWGTNEDTLINCLMLTVQDPTTVRGIKSYYYSLYSEKLRDRIVSETEGTLKTFLLGVLDRGVMNETTVSESQQATDLNEMKGLMEGQNIDGIATFLTSISLNRINTLQRSYFMETADELVTVLAEMTGHHVKDCFTSLLLVARDFNYYAAYELQASMEGRGTDEGTLTRIIVTRSDKDLSFIKDSYKKLTTRELSKDVKDDTSGDYRRVLLALIN